LVSKTCFLNVLLPNTSWVFFGPVFLTRFLYISLEISTHFILFSSLSYPFCLFFFFFHAEIIEIAPKNELRAEQKPVFSKLKFVFGSSFLHHFSSFFERFCWFSSQIARNSYKIDEKSSFLGANAPKNELFSTTYREHLLWNNFMVISIIWFFNVLWHKAIRKILD